MISRINSNASHVRLMAWLLGCCLAAGCQQKMARQPSYKPLETCDFFADGRWPLGAVPGTVARGHLRTDTAFFTGRRKPVLGDLPIGDLERGATTKQPDRDVKPPDEREAKLPGFERNEDFVDVFPIPITKEVVERGRDRYMIYCVLC